MLQVNPIDIMSMIRQGQNPQQIMLNLLEQEASSTPLGKNLIELAKQNKTAEIEQIARNLARERGIDYDKEFNAFKQKLGLK